MALPLCSSESALRLDGAPSYLKFLHQLDEDQQDFRLSLRFRTVQRQGLIVATNGSTAWGALQVLISSSLLERVQRMIVSYKSE